MIFRCNQKSMEALAEQLQTTHMEKEECLKYLQDATDVKYGWAYINLSNHTKEAIYYSYHPDIGFRSVGAG